MKRVLLLFMAVCLCFSFAACSKKEKTEEELFVPITQAEIKTAIEDYLEPQINAYKKAFGVEDLSVDVQIMENDLYNPFFNLDGKMEGKGSVYCTIRDIIICPNFFESLESGDFTDEMLKQLSAIAFEYEDFEYGDYKISVFSRLACPIFADTEGTEYTVSEDILLKGDIIAYIAEDAHLEYPAKVGDNINVIMSEMLAQSDGSSSSAISSSEKCINCNGTGYVRYYYGESDLQAYLEGYDPYYIGECPLCDGTGR